MLITIATLLVSLVVWYLYYGLECFINGGAVGRNSYLMHFPLMWQEFTWIAPGGWKRKLAAADGNEELAKTLPGPFHFVMLHIIVPFAPAFVAWCWLVE